MQLITSARGSDAHPSSGKANASMSGENNQGGQGDRFSDSGDDF